MAKVKESPLQKVLNDLFSKVRKKEIPNETFLDWLEKVGISIANKDGSNVVFEDSDFTDERIEALEKTIEAYPEIIPVPTLPASSSSSRPDETPAEAPEVPESAQGAESQKVEKNEKKSEESVIDEKATPEKGRDPSAPGTADEGDLKLYHNLVKYAEDQGLSDYQVELEDGKKTYVQEWIYLELRKQGAIFVPPPEDVASYFCFTPSILTHAIITNEQSKPVFLKLEEHRKQALKDMKGWDLKLLHELGLKGPTAPTILFQRICELVEKAGVERSRISVHHGPIANGRDKMSFPVLAELARRMIDMVKTKEGIDEAVATEKPAEETNSTSPEKQTPPGPPKCFGCDLKPAMVYLKDAEPVAYSCNFHKKDADGFKKAMGFAMKSCRSRKMTEGDWIFEEVLRAVDAIAEVVVPDRIRSGKCSAPDCQGSEESGSCKCDFTEKPVEKKPIPCETEDCTMEAVWKLGAKKVFYACDFCAENVGQLKRMRKRERLESPIKDAQDLASSPAPADPESKQGQGSEKEPEKPSDRDPSAPDTKTGAPPSPVGMAESGRLLTIETVSVPEEVPPCPPGSELYRIENLELVNARTGKIRTLGVIARRLALLQAEKKAVEKTLAGEKKRLEDSINSLWDLYGDSIRVVLEKECESQKVVAEDGTVSYRRKFIVTRFGKVGAEKRGGSEFKVVDKNKAIEFAKALTPEERLYYGFSIKWEFDEKTMKLRHDDGIPIDGFEEIEEEEKEFGFLYIRD